MTAAIFIALYGSERTIERAFSNTFANMTAGLPVYAVNNHYPFWGKDFVNNIAKKYNITMIDKGENLGHFGSINLLNEMFPTDYHIVIEPDDLISFIGWDSALLDVVKHDSVICATLHNRDAYAEMLDRGYYTENINGYNCRIPTKAVVTGCSIFKTEWVLRTAGHKDENKYYGGSECIMFNKCKQHGNERWVFLDDVPDGYKYDHEDFDDKVYTQYKEDHARTIPRFVGSFDDYLKHQGIYLNKTT